MVIRPRRITESGLFVLCIVQGCQASAFVFAPSLSKTVTGASNHPVVIWLRGFHIFWARHWWTEKVRESSFSSRNSLWSNEHEYKLSMWSAARDPSPALCSSKVMNFLAGFNFGIWKQYCVGRPLTSLTKHYYRMANKVRKRDQYKRGQVPK